LEQAGLARGELNGVWASGDNGAHGGPEVFDAGQEDVFVEESVVDSDVKAFAIGAEETVEAGLMRHE
jgi:hypothetical protein